MRTCDSGIAFRSAEDNDGGDATEKYHYLGIVEARGYFITFKNSMSENRVAWELCEMHSVLHNFEELGRSVKLMDKKIFLCDENKLAHNR